MVTRQERQRLIDAYANPPLYASGVVAQCSVCMLVVLGIGVIGATVGPQGSSLQVQTASAHGAAGAATARPDAR